MDWPRWRRPYPDLELWQRIKEKRDEQEHLTELAKVAESIIKSSERAPRGPN